MTTPTESLTYNHLDLTERERIRNLNWQALVEVQSLTGFIIPPQHQADWRPTKPATGLITGIPIRLTCLATDGSRGLFTRVDDVPSNYFLGHIEHFDQKVETLYSSAKPSKPKERTARAPRLLSARQLRIELLKSL